ncbi:TSUP family transporter [Oceaniglobus ichthyenteri]|uniref:TSUP family transporter n=1 Tax=Oceaniglobus ichthyenteri TaxID=2136177 RepID=UPI000D34883E|nr:TSUP family transporter [Oceaniglobus ichthyenteri]
MNTLAALTDLSPLHLAILAGLTFVAGLVRGFSGFALSAMVMASAIMILPPVELIPVCWWLEMTASLLMARGGWADADRGVTTGLVLGSTVGVPLGLALTTNVDVATSKLIALVLILVLATTQLARLRMAFLATKPGLYGSGFLSGIATGLAGVGGMVVALYVLSSNSPARQMRGSLVLYLLLSLLISLVTLLWFGVMDRTATARGLALALPAALGVLGGQLLFTPRFERFYRPFCLSLLMALASVGLIRTVI